MTNEMAVERLVQAAFDYIENKCSADDLQQVKDYVVSMIKPQVRRVPDYPVPMTDIVFEEDSGDSLYNYVGRVNIGGDGLLEVHTSYGIHKFDDITRWMYIDMREIKNTPELYEPTDYDGEDF